MPTVVRVTVVLPAHNRRDLTLQALRSLDRMVLDGIDLKTVVVDDGSTDGTADAIAVRFPDVTIVRGDGTLYYGGALRLGIEQALTTRPDYVVMANDDAIFDQQLIRELTAAASTIGRAVVGALLLRWDRPHEVFQVGQAWGTWYGGWRIPTSLTAFTVPATPWHVESLSGNCVIVPAEAIEEAGLPDAVRFPHHWADAEFSARLRRRGWQLAIAPSARAYCQPNAIPAPLGSLSGRALVEALWRDRLHPMNLRGRWRLLWHTAPTRLQGTVAFAVLVVRLALRGLGVGRWPHWPDPPLGPVPSANSR